MNEIDKVIKEIETAIYPQDFSARTIWLHRKNDIILQALNDKLERDEMRCEDCKHKDTEFCRAVWKTKYNLKTERWTCRTMMEPEGYCHIFEPARKSSK